MKDFVFISDFDGTITAKDFYWILLDDYIGQKGIEFYHEWKKSKKIGTEFLNTVFTWYKFTDKERLEALDKVEIDKELIDVIKLVNDLNGEFVILSAGFDYYINHVLERNNLNNIKLLTNKGDFKNDTFIMEPDEDSKFYSPVYGIDKGSVARHYKTIAKKIYFVGDSEPDYYAAIEADVIFAKTELAVILDSKGIKYYTYESFGDILTIMKQGV